jgi:hypothetical protein
MEDDGRIQPSLDRRATSFSPQDAHEEIPLAIGEWRVL